LALSHSPFWIAYVPVPTPRDQPWPVEEATSGERGRPQGVARSVGGEPQGSVSCQVDGVRRPKIPPQGSGPEEPRRPELPTVSAGRKWSSPRFLNFVRGHIGTVAYRVMVPAAWPY